MLLTMQGIPSLGSILGTTASQEIVNNINQNMNAGQGFFGSMNDIFAKGRNFFVEKIVNPTINAAINLKNAAVKLSQQDVMISLQEPDDFNYVPPCMHMPILTFEPVRKLHQQGRVFGFGYDPDFIHKEDTWGRLINNGSVDDIELAANEQGEFTVNWEYDEDDPEYTFEELDYISDTRQAIVDLLENTDKDPTSYPNTRG